MSTRFDVPTASAGADGYRRQFSSWKRERPFWGGVLLIVSGLLIGIIPLDLAVKFALVPAEFAYIGLIFTVFVLLCGVFALAQPELASFFGVAGMLIAVASIFGALGGFVIGSIVGVAGGSLCVAWEPPAETE
ncbi:DUF6114 domain-containing protein [Halomarina halobia]|uniref:DUF6114 domain-containing protein n=1 Tax=Halomarina halobia TaxID=3033386 RepID=A0ABD6A494_9EURY|nr:DUF6114 domain-containing protein [Halomarina sp. PSR21]